MFVVLSSETPVIRFRLYTECSYSHVGLVSVEADSDVSYVIGDFVEHSHVNGRLIGIVGVGRGGKYYVPINIRRKELSITLVDENLSLIAPQQVKVVLHLKN